MAFRLLVVVVVLQVLRSCRNLIWFHSKTYNNIKWYKPLSDLEVKILEEGISSPTDDVAASDSVAEPNFKNQAPSSPFAQTSTGTELTDDDIPF